MLYIKAVPCLNCKVLLLILGLKPTQEFPDFVISDTGNTINILKSKMITSTKTVPTAPLLDLQHGSLRNKPFDHKTLSLIFLWHQQLQTTSFISKEKEPRVLSVPALMFQRFCRLQVNIDDCHNH